MNTRYTKAEVMAMVTGANPVINYTANRIEFADGTCYATDRPGSGEGFYKAHNYNH